VFSTSAMTVAAVLRLVDHSTVVQINGESYRRRRARRVGQAAKG
jgi:DNA replication protein DnaC